MNYECNEIFNADLLNYAQVFKIMTAPLGNYAPRLRLLSIDYKRGDGKNCSQDIATGQHPDTTDGQLVERVRSAYTENNLDVSAITEVIPAGSELSTRCLYLKRSFWEETLRESRFPTPWDIAGSLELCGIHPVNWEELTHGR